MSEPSSTPTSEEPFVAPHSNRPVYRYDHSGTFAAKWRNMWNISLGRLGEQGLDTWNLEQEIKRWPKDCTKCEKWRHYMWNYSPIIRFMDEKIGKLGGNLSEESFSCTFCGDKKIGGFDPDYGITLCANKMLDKHHLEDAMAHEMVHVYDHLRFKVNWDDDLRHAACTEIRASALSGECRFLKEFFGRYRFKYALGFQDCVRRRAMLSIRARPSCKDDAMAARVLDEVWDSCLGDTRPFDEVYK